MGQRVLISFILSLTLFAGWASAEKGHRGRPRSLNFIGPNETHSAAFKKVLKGRTQTMVCVGTYRCFSNLFYGAFDSAVFFDFNPLAVEFNQWLAFEIMDAHDRKALVQKVFAENAPAVEKAISEAFSSNDIRPLRSAAQKLQRLSLTKDPVRESYTPTLENAIRSFANDLLFSGAVDNVDQFAGSFFADDSAFAIIKHKLKTTQIAFMNGDLADADDMKRLEAQVKEFGNEISILDVSNAWDTILMTAANQKSFADNLEKLNYSKDAHILFTNFRPGILLEAFHPESRSDFDPFSYYAATPKKFIRSLARSEAIRHLLTSPQAAYSETTLAFKSPLSLIDACDHHLQRRLF